MKSICSFSVCVILVLLGGDVFSQGFNLIAMVKTQSGWGYIDTTGQFAVLPRFSRVFGMGNHGHAMVAVWQEKLDLSGEKFGIIKVSPYDNDPVYLTEDYNTESFEYTRFKDGFFLAKELDGTYSYIDTSGTTMFDYVYDYATPFENNKATATSEGYCYIVTSNKADRLVLEDTCNKAWEFNDGVAVFQGKDGRFAAMDTSGKMLFEPRFKKIGSFQNGIAWAREKRKKVGFINTKGEYVIQPIYSHAKDMDSTSGKARVKTSETSWFYIDTAGNETMMYGLGSQGDFHEGLCWGKGNGGYGFFDQMGKWAIRPEFEGVRNFKNGYAAAKKNGRWGFIDKTGKWLLFPEFVRVKDFEAVNL